LLSESVRAEIAEWLAVPNSEIMPLHRLIVHSPGEFQRLFDAHDVWASRH
jgi:hypothetical protein